MMLRQNILLRQTASAILSTLVMCWLSLGTSEAAEDRITLSRSASDSGPVVLRTVMIEDEDGDPVAAGKAAARALKKAMGDVKLDAVLISECFEDIEYKEELLEGICSILPERVIFGSATYGSFTQKGCTDFDAVCLLGIGGAGVGVTAALVTEIGTSKLVAETDQPLIEKRLRKAGAGLAEKLNRSDADRLLIVTADAHSPKNQYLVEGLQSVVGSKFPITGGSANKNAGQTFVYYQGKAYKDSAVALMLSGNFKVAMSGRQAKDNDRVISSAKEGAAEALDRLDSEPIGVLAFNCAGRRGKLDDFNDELGAIQEALGRDLPMFGCYNAGEIGPLDTGEAKPGVLSGGGGWHVMFTVIGK